MANITHLVWDFLHKNPAIEKNLAEDFINVMALAKYIIKKEKIKASTHAIISAIRRYKQEHKKNDSNNKVGEILKNSKISTKSRLLSIMISRDFSFLAVAMPKIFNSIDVTKGELLRIAEGRETMKIFIDNGKLDEIMNFLPKERVYTIEENLGEINIHFDANNEKTQGLVPTVLNELAVNDINIIEIIGGVPELIIIVKEKHISKAHDILLRFFYGDDH